MIGAVIDIVRKTTHAVEKVFRNVNLRQIHVTGSQKLKGQSSLFKLRHSVAQC